MAMRQGGIRRPITQYNGAPRGFGQESPYLDRRQDPYAGTYVDRYGEQSPAEQEEAYRRGEYKRTQPERERYEVDQSPDPEEFKPAYWQALDDLEGEHTSSAVRNATAVFSDQKGIDTSAGAANSQGAQAANDYAVPREPAGAINGSVTGARTQEFIDTNVDGIDDRDQPDLFGDVTGDKAPFDESGMPQGAHWGQDYRFQGLEGIPSAQDFAYGDTSRVRGFATDQWGPGGDPNYDEDSLKNFFGKLASQIDPRSPGARDQLMAHPEFKKLFPAATAVSFDKIDFGDGNPVDVMINGQQDGSGEVWAFQTGADGSSAFDGEAGVGSAASWDEAYQMMRSLDPNLPQDEMESALARIFSGLPGYGGVYKESVMRDGGWQDLVGGYGGPNAQWQVLNKDETPGGYGGTVGALQPAGLPQGQNLAALAAQLGLDGNQIQELLDQLLRDGQQQFNGALP